MDFYSLLIPFSLFLCLTGIYLNCAFLRTTHHSTVYSKFLTRNLRFICLFQIFLAFSNIIFTVAAWGGNEDRTPRSEVLLSFTLALTDALPSLTLFWISVERFLYNRISVVQNSNKYFYTVVFRVVQILVSLAIMITANTVFEENSETKNSESNIAIPITLLHNFYFEYIFAFLIVFSILLALVTLQIVQRSYKRSLLLGGLRNDQRVQNLKNQRLFFFHSFLPLSIICSINLLLHYYGKQLFRDRKLIAQKLKKSIKLRRIPDEHQDLIYVTIRGFLPISYPISLIVLHSKLRVDYFANIILCRKAKSIHKESKVKVIATKESQESIIANLKMIGILSDVDGNKNQNAPLRRPSSHDSRKNLIVKDGASTSSINGRISRLSSTGNSVDSGNQMIFQQRNKPTVVQN